MSTKKNIEQLFQEKFKDFEANPAEEVWNNIEEKLDEKKRRRVIPFWWKLSGVAAIFVIGFFVSNALFTENNIFENPAIKEQPVVKDENLNQQNKETIKTDSKGKEINIKSTTKSIDDAVVTKSSNKNGIQQVNRKQNTIANTANAAVAVLINEKKSPAKSNSKAAKNNLLAAENSSPATKNELIENKENLSNTEKSVAKTDVISNQINSVLSHKNINLDELKNKNSITVNTEVEKKNNDSVVKNSVVTNALEELLNEKESKTKQELKINRWQLTSNVAPVFLGSISKGSPIDSILVNNSKSYNTNIGFGLGISYAVNSKVSVRTGLNKVNMSYNTNDILFFAAIQSRPLTSVTPTASSSKIQIQSNVSNNPNASLSENTLLPFENALSRQSAGSLTQEIGYLEMPMEMTYTVVNKKFGLRVIAGFSTLFLQDNSITIVSNTGNTPLGEANNLNNINFSSNLGLGIKYSFMKSFEFNIEPTIKYQLNTFSSNAGNFQPYIIGVYSGISYKF